MLCFQDHLVFPATEYNATQRPKMSFMIMAPPNSKLSLFCLFVACSINLADTVCKGELKGFSYLFLGTEWQQGHSANTDEISMMQIDCQVMDTKIVNIKRSSIPVQHSDSSHFGTPSVTVPNGNAYVKPAK